jgi:hypothetical protein
MKKARAAQIWAGLEKRLIERCGLPDGHMLDRERPNLIRRIGAVLTGKAAAGDTVSPPLPENKPRRLVLDGIEHAIPHRTFRGGGMAVARDDSVPQIRARKLSLQSDTIHDPKLAAYLDRACSRRSGYDGDDSVGYS